MLHRPDVISYKVASPPRSGHHDDDAVLDDGRAALADVLRRRGAVGVLGAGPQPLHGGAQDAPRRGHQRPRRLGGWVRTDEQLLAL